MIPSTPGHGKWRLPGRGRRLKCHAKGSDPGRGIVWHKASHYFSPCRWCGQTQLQVFRRHTEQMIGYLQGVRFISLPS